jgi:hypothetical protein
MAQMNINDTPATPEQLQVELEDAVTNAKILCPGPSSAIDDISCAISDSISLASRESQAKSIKGNALVEIRKGIATLVQEASRRDTNRRVLRGSGLSVDTNSLGDAP